MAERKKRKETPPPGVPPWMATFSDLMTLLLTFFVMLMAMASFERRVEIWDVMESMRDAFSRMGLGDGLVSQIYGEQRSDQRRREESVKPRVVRDRTKQDGELADAVVKVASDKTETRLVLEEDIFFDTGSANLIPGARAKLRDLGLSLAEQQIRIVVEGHTDDIGDEAKNWSLSVERASRVVEVLHMDGRIEIERLTARGHGPSQPIAKFEEDVMRNRRIELVLSGDDAQVYEALDAVRRLGVTGG
jgi:chemotaxis protein MotB